MHQSLFFRMAFSCAESAAATVEQRSVAHEGNDSGKNEAWTSVYDDENG